MLHLKADLHIHSCLSPCAEEDMNPVRVLARARELGFDLIALADHHHGGNVHSFREKGNKLGINVLPAMEVETVERVHLLCLFDTIEQLKVWHGHVMKSLPRGINPRYFYGPQLLVDEEGQVIGEVMEQLLSPLSLDVFEVVQRVRRLGGLVIAAHLDRSGHSLIFHMGLEAAKVFPAVEISCHMEPAVAREIYDLAPTQAVLVSSDAHFLAELKPPRVTLHVAEVSVKELELAFRGQDGRWVEYV
ncbi:MAG: PHP domain-containing protein [Thermincolia bacterium]